MSKRTQDARKEPSRRPGYLEASAPSDGHRSTIADAMASTPSVARAPGVDQRASAEHADDRAAETSQERLMRAEPRRNCKEAERAQRSKQRIRGSRAKPRGEAERRTLGHAATNDENSDRPHRCCHTETDDDALKNETMIHDEAPFERPARLERRGHLRTFTFRGPHRWRLRR